MNPTTMLKVVLYYFDMLTFQVEHKYRWRDLPNSLKGQEGLKRSEEGKSGARINRLLSFAHSTSSSRNN